MAAGPRYCRWVYPNGVLCGEPVWESGGHSNHPYDVRLCTRHYQEAQTRQMPITAIKKLLGESLV